PYRPYLARVYAAHGYPARLGASWVCTCDTNGQGPIHPQHGTRHTPPSSPACALRHANPNTPTSDPTGATALMTLSRRGGERLFTPRYRVCTVAAPPGWCRAAWTCATG